MPIRGVSESPQSSYHTPPVELPYSSSRVALLPQRHFPAPEGVIVASQPRWLPRRLLRCCHGVLTVLSRCSHGVVTVCNRLITQLLGAQCVASWDFFANFHVRACVMKLNEYPQSYHQQDAFSVLVVRLRIIIINFMLKQCQVCLLPLLNWPAAASRAQGAPETVAVHVKVDCFIMLLVRFRTVVVD